MQPSTEPHQNNAMNWIKNVNVEIGGQEIDKHTGEWLSIWTNLTHSADKAAALESMCYGTGIGSHAYVPLQFWFCRNPGLALPLIALQYHEVKFHIEFENDKVGVNSGTLDDVELWCDYIYLDTDERRRFAQVSH
jgi:hypothetical protein